MPGSELLLECEWLNWKISIRILLLVVPDTFKLLWKKISGLFWEFLMYSRLGLPLAKWETLYMKAAFASDLWLTLCKCSQYWLSCKKGFKRDFKCQNAEKAIKRNVFVRSVSLFFFKQTLLHNCNFYFYLELIFKLKLVWVSVYI